MRTANFGNTINITIFIFGTKTSKADGHSRAPKLCEVKAILTFIRYSLMIIDQYIIKKTAEIFLLTNK